MKTAEGQSDPSVFLAQNPLLHEYMGIHRLDHARHSRAAQPGGGAETGSAVKEKDIGIARRRLRHPIQPSLAPVSQFVGDRRGHAQLEARKVDILQMIGADKFAGNFWQCRARTEPRKTAHKGAQTASLRQGASIGIMVCAIRGGVGDTHILSACIYRFFKYLQILHRDDRGCELAQMGVGALPERLAEVWPSQ